MARHVSSILCSACTCERGQRQVSGPVRILLAKLVLWREQSPAISSHLLNEQLLLRAVHNLGARVGASVQLQLQQVTQGERGVHDEALAGGLQGAQAWPGG